MSRIDSYPASSTSHTHSNLSNDAWTAYTPTIKLGATTVTVTSDCRYVRHGRLVVVQMGWRYTNLNGGTGTLTATLPFPHRASTLGHDYTQSPGTGGLIDVSTAALYSCFVHYNSTTDVHFRTAASPSAAFSNTVPTTLAVGALNVGDEHFATVTYETDS